MKEFCGLFGVWGNPNAVILTYLGLHSLQHRGQESVGIASVVDGKIIHHRGLGLITTVFTKEILNNLKSSASIGHVRYSTTGSSNLINTQPFVISHKGKMLAIAHNGNIVNSNKLKKELEEKGSIFQTTMDSEIIMHLLMRVWEFKDNKISGLKKTLSKVKGAYSLLFLTSDEMIAVRDPNGFRPLCLGKIKGLFPTYAIASESVAFDIAGIEYIRDIEPGEILHISQKGQESEKIISKRKPSFCIFEYVYFARPDSQING